ncbi:hypothetical protein [Rhizobium grahamii]|uniref:Uncharacterized protein n=1 Tax=Rhizobium grahamii CCGE 502 TaxID=990285 RepID=S3HX14_9HYPH|nr:hypothetical protein [Rhizobium grahamii]EPE97651.1 hypothetical protein RGCCGE502_12259 [Rhizobium grahamii CCGE 502]
MIKTADQALAVLDIAKALFAETLLLVYLRGSAVSSGLQRAGLRS